jgi:hypothetical protein
VTGSLMSSPPAAAARNPYTDGLRGWIVRGKGGSAGGRAPADAFSSYSTALAPAITATTVRNRIFTSSQSEKLSM